jgi:hypothetical protein
VSLCRKHPGLRSVILDLPEAVQHAETILAEEKMGERVTHRPGNALTDELGTEAIDERVSGWASERFRSADGVLGCQLHLVV